MPDVAWPGIEPRTYRHPLLDSRRWEAVASRPDDIVITTSIKAGTTWMQSIVASLLWEGAEPPAPMDELSPWIELTMLPLDRILGLLEAQAHRRFMKSHCPPCAVPRRPGSRYVVVCRDGRDVLLSLDNHHRRFNRDILAVANQHCAEDPECTAPPMPSEDLDVHELFAGWISRGTIPGEGDGYPYWSHLTHLAQWWTLRHEPDVCLVHFNDLLADLEGEMRRVAAFLEVDVPEAAWPQVVERATFADMRRRADAVVPSPMAFEGGGRGFLHAGTNGRWHDVLTADEVARYEARVAEVLPPDAAAWMADGGPVH